MNLISSGCHIAACRKNRYTHQSQPAHFFANFVTNTLKFWSISHGNYTGSPSYLKKFNAAQRNNHCLT